MIFSFDTETALIQPGLLAPPIVCGSMASEDHGVALLDRDGALRWFQQWLVWSDAHLVGAKIDYDVIVCLVALGSPLRLVQKVFEAYDAGRVHDVQIREGLDAIAKGLVRDDEGRRVIIDPATGSALLDPESGKQATRYSLAICSALVLGERMAKKNTWRLSYALLEDVPLDQWPASARQYIHDDADKPLRIFLKQAQSHENLHDEPRQVKAAFAGALSSTWGMRTDPVAVAELRARVEEKHAAFEAKQRALGLIRDGINPATGRPYPASQQGTRDMAKLKALVSAAYQGNPPLTEKGAVSTAADTLRESGDDDLEELAGDGNEKILNTYLPLLEQGTRVPINPKFNALLATGRSSYFEPSLQVLPRKGGVRECFVPRPGNAFFSVDWSGAELAAIAQCCLWLPDVGFSRLGEALNAGQDAHVRLSARILGISYEDAAARKRAKEPLLVGVRQMAKQLNFGKWGGMGAPKVVFTARKDNSSTTTCPNGFVYTGTRFCVLARRAERCGERKLTEWKGREIRPTCAICLELAVEYDRIFAAEWEEFPLYLAAAAREADAGGRVEQFVSKRIRGGLGYCQCANTKFQGLIADCAKDAFWQITKECYAEPESALFGARIPNFVHDEMFGEAPLERAAAAAGRCAEIMNETAKRFMPDVKCEGEPALMLRWQKAAEPVWVNGKLIPWEPAA